MKWYLLWLHDRYSTKESEHLIFRWKWIRSIHEFCRDCCTLMHGGS